jgi:hypothetical protein
MGRRETIWGQRWCNGQATITGLSHFVPRMPLYNALRSHVREHRNDKAWVEFSLTSDGVTSDKEAPTMTTIWQPIATASRQPASNPSAGRYRRMSQGPTLALIGYIDDQCVLMRGCCAQVDDNAYWWDLDAGESVEIPVVAWAPLPNEMELAQLSASARGVGFG